MKTIHASIRAHHLARFCIFLITAALIAGMAGCGPLASEIHDWYELDAMRNNLAGSYILMNDLDSTKAGYEELASPTANGGKGWEPIGTEYEFIGSFDGQGHEIHDLFIDHPPEEWWIHVGLFSSVGEKGSIKDIGVVNATVTGESHTGGLVGSSSGTVSNSYSTGSVTGSSHVGGLVGWNYESTVSNSYSTGSVTGDNNVGGLVGENEFDGVVSNSFWDTETSGQSTSDGGTGKTTAQMKNIATFSGAGWNIIEVGGFGERNPAYIWNIVDDENYPFLSWQP